MGSIAFFLAILLVFYIIYWSIKNDHADSIKNQSGFLKMIDHESKKSDRAKRRSKRTRR